MVLRRHAPSFFCRIVQRTQKRSRSYVRAHEHIVVPICFEETWRLQEILVQNYFSSYSKETAILVFWNAIVKLVQTLILQDF